MTIRSCLPILAILAILAIPAAAQEPTPPPSASVTGVTNFEWPSGLNEVAAFGQLVEQRGLTVNSTDERIDSTVALVIESTAPSIDSTIVIVDSTDVIVRSGVSTQASFLRINATDVVQSLVPRKKGATPFVEASQLCGTGYQFGRLKGAKVPAGVTKGADRNVTFATENDALTRLENLVASNIPVMVDVDFFFLFDEAVTQEPGIAAAGKQHVSRYIVVTGYDASNIIFADHGPESELGGTGLDITVTTSSFLSAWSGTKTLKTPGVAGPDFMLIVSSKPVLTAPDLTLGIQGEDSAAAPKAITLAAKMLRAGKDSDIVLNQASVFADTRSAMGDFASSDSQVEIAADYRDSSNLWRIIAESTDTSTIPGNLDLIAADEDGGLGIMQGLVALGPDAIELLSPADNVTLDDISNVTFRWAALPSVGKTVLQITGSGDFTNKKTLVTIPPTTGKKSVTMTAANWGKVFGKNPGVTSIQWRVTGLGKNVGIVSATRTLTFEIPRFTNLTPDNGAAIDSTDLPTFTWTSNGTPLKPQVVLSTTGVFTDKSDRIVLKPKPGESSVTMTMATFNKLEKKDTDKTVFWRMEDASAKLSDVLPSDPFTFTIP
jgi:hypothetical protein